MADEGEPKILGFTKREAEILIMSLQVIRPNPCTTNGCTARPNDLVRIGAYGDADTARRQYAALRARVMALNYLSTPVSQGQGASAVTAGNDRDDLDEPDQNEKGEESKKSPPFLTTKDQRNPFLLTAEEKKKIGFPALPGQTKLGEGVVDDDLPTEKEWDDMGDSNAC